jgi:hypothetical protein
VSERNPSTKSALMPGREGEKKVTLCGRSARLMPPSSRILSKKCLRRRTVEVLSRRVRSDSTETLVQPDVLEVKMKRSTLKSDDKIYQKLYVDSSKHSVKCAKLGPRAQERGRRPSAAQERKRNVRRIGRERVHERNHRGNRSSQLHRQLPSHLQSHTASNHTATERCQSDRASARFPLSPCTGDNWIPTYGRLNSIATKAPPSSKVSNG